MSGPAPRSRNAARRMTAALDQLTRRARARRFRFADPSMILWLALIAC